MKKRKSGSNAALYMMGAKTPGRYFVVKSGESFAVADSKGKLVSKVMSPTQFRIAKRHALTSLESDPSNILSPELQALIRYQDVSQV